MTIQNEIERYANYRKNIKKARDKYLERNQMSSYYITKDLSEEMKLWGQTKKEQCDKILDILRKERAKNEAYANKK